ncbi:MAG: DUF4159 domain-containing protein [Verrucomicrobiota bacterium]
MNRFTILISLLTFGCGIWTAQGQSSSDYTLYRDRAGVDEWENDPRFPQDTFRFVRLRPEDHRDWYIDYPGSDLNFSFRLQQMTSIRVDPDPIVVSILDPKLRECPFLYTLETHTLNLLDEEIVVLRDHLLNGGFLMIDDFWGPSAWRHTHDELKRLFPDRPIRELSLDHPVFNIVFQIKEKPQVPGLGIGIESQFTGRTWTHGGKDPNFYGIFDDAGRMMVIVCRNTDLGDGWECEGDDPYYFKEFSEKKAYPMGVNIIVYAMTH